MMTILTSASAEAFASFVMSRYRESGYDTRAVQRITTTCLFMNMERMGDVRNEGNTAARTCGIVSPRNVRKRGFLLGGGGPPMMTQKETMPPAAKKNCAKDTAI